MRTSMHLANVVLISVSALCLPVLAGGIRPVVLMHGLFATSEAMSGIQQWLESDFPGIYVHNAEVPYQSSNVTRYDSLLISMNDQVADFAKQLAADPNLQNGFDMICHSQGGLLCRGFIERFNTPRAHNFISLAGPHAGVFGVPDLNAWCPDAECPWLVDFMNSISESGWTEPLLQSTISFAQYWKNSLNYSLYLNVSGYLADVNNERDAKNPVYRENLLNITGGVTLVMALLDQIVVPRESAWFEFYELGQDTIVQNLTSSQQYIGDWLGLRTLDSQQRLERIAVECGHQNLPRQACKTVVYDAVIKPRVGGQLPTH